MYGNRGKERRATRLSDEEFEAIASRAAEKAMEKVYVEIGQNVVKRLFWVICTVLIFVFGWLVKIGKIAI